MSSLGRRAILRLLEAQELKPASKLKSGTSNPYAIVRIQEKNLESEVVPATLNPRWNQTWEVQLNPKDSIEILVYHKSHLKDKQIGKTLIDLSIEGLFTKQGCWYNLNCKNYQAGRVRVGVSWINAEEQNEIFPAVKNESGVLQVTILEAKNLRLVDEKIGTCNPYCKIFVNETSFKTQVQTSNINPRWDQTFYAASPLNPPSQILIELKHDNLIKQNLVIGEVLINTSNLKPNEPLDTWFPVNGKTGMLRVIMVYLPECVANILSTKGVVQKYTKKTSRKAKQIAVHTGNEMIRNTTRIMLYLADRMAKRIHSRGFEGLIKVILKCGVKLQWDIESHHSRQKLLYDNINEDKDGRLTRLVSALTDKIIDLNIVMALRMQEMKIEGLVGTFAKCPVTIPNVVSLGYISLEQRVDSRSIIKNLHSLNKAELAKVKQMMEDEVGTDPLVLDLPEDSSFRQGTLRVTIKGTEAEFYGTNTRRGGSWIHTRETSSQGGLMVAKASPKKRIRNSNGSGTQVSPVVRKPLTLFCEVELHDTSKRTSPLDGVGPVWNETLSFSCPVLPPKRIEIAIMDDNTCSLPPSAFQRSRWSSRAGQIVRMRVKTKELLSGDGSSRTPTSCEKSIPFSGGELKVGLEFDPNAITPHVNERVPYSTLGFSKMLQLATKILVYSALQLRRQANLRQWHGTTITAFGLIYARMTTYLNIQDTEAEARVKLQDQTNENADAEKLPPELAAAGVEKIIDAAVSQLMDVVTEIGAQINAMNSKGDLWLYINVPILAIGFFFGYELKTESIMSSQDHRHHAYEHNQTKKTKKKQEERINMRMAQIKKSKNIENDQSVISSDVSESDLVIPLGSCAVDTSPTRNDKKSKFRNHLSRKSASSRLTPPTTPSPSPHRPYSTSITDVRIPSPEQSPDDQKHSHNPSIGSDGHEKRIGHIHTNGHPHDDHENGHGHGHGHGHDKGPRKGILTVRIHNAKNINELGGNDAYRAFCTAMVQIQDIELAASLKTKISREEANPTWDEDLLLPCIASLEKKTLVIKLKAERTFNTPELLSTLSLNLADLADSLPIHEKIYQLESGATLTISVSFDANADTSKLDSIRIKRLKSQGLKLGICKKLLREAVKAMVYASQMVCKAIDEKHWHGAADIYLTIFTTTVMFSVTNQRVEEAAELPKIDLMVTRFLKKVVKKVIGGMESASLEVQRMGQQGELHLGASGYIPFPPPVPAKLVNICVAAVVHTESVQNNNIPGWLGDSAEARSNWPLVAVTPPMQRVTQ